MPKLLVTTRNGDVKTVPATVGHSIMESICGAGISEMQAICGGCATCCTCHVFVDPERLNTLPLMSEHEDAALESSEARTASSRLACQIPVTDALDGLRLTIAPEA